MAQNEQGIFITHTEPSKRGSNEGNRATIACSIVGNKIVYGIAICSNGDNFSRKKGRELAEERLKNDYGIYDLAPKDGKVNFYRGMKDPQTAVTLFALNLRRAVARNYDRYKRRIHEYRVNSFKKHSNSTAVN